MSDRERVPPTDGRRADLLALAFIAAVALAVTWPVTIGSRALLPTSLYLRIQPWRAHAHEFPDAEPVDNPILDAVQQFYPWRLYASRVVRTGEVPLWNTQMLSGTPFVGNGQSAVFYPETWLHYVIDPLKALGWATFAFYLIAGWGMYLLLRVLGAGPLAGAIGGVTFIFSGFFTGWLTFPTLRSVAAWLPLALVGIELAVRRRQGGWLALTSLAVGMQFLAGHLQVSLYVLTVLAAYALFRLLVCARHLGGATVARYAALVIAATAVGGLLAACHLGPTLELAMLSSRTAGTTYEGQIGNALAPQQMLLLLMPDAFGNPVDSNHWGTNWPGRSYRTYVETTWYFGIAPLLLAIAAVALRRDRQSWFWLGVFVAAVGLAFGTPLNALFRLIPGYVMLPGVGRAVVLACTSGAVLAGLGADTLMRLGDDPRARTVVSGAALVLLISGLAGGLATWVHTGALEDAMRAAGLEMSLGTYTLIQLARFAGLLLVSWALIARGLDARHRWAWYALAVVVAIDLGYFAAKFTPAGRTDYLDVRSELAARIHEAGEAERMAAVGPDFLNRVAPNTHMILDLQSAQGSESIIFDPYSRLLVAAQSDRLGYWQVDPAAPLLDLMAVRWLSSTLPIDDEGWRLEALAETRLYENTQAVPRAFVPAAVEPMADNEAVFAQLNAGGDPLTARVTEPAVTHWEATERPDLAITGYSANRVVVEGELRAGSWAVLADVACPGWRAFADGVETPIIAADLVRRAVHLDRDARELRFVYLPASFHLGMFATLMALAALGALGGALLTGRRGA